MSEILKQQLIEFRKKLVSLKQELNVIYYEALISFELQCEIAPFEEKIGEEISLCNKKIGELVE